jgi:hypothetical protein
MRAMTEATNTPLDFRVWATAAGVTAVNTASNRQRQSDCEILMRCCSYRIVEAGEKGIVTAAALGEAQRL